MRKAQFGRPIWPVLLAAVLYLACTANGWYRIAAATHGTHVYVLDDTYIQAAIGRDIAFSHSYGVSPGVFATASSSLLWPVLLAFVFKLAGLHLWFLLALNIVFGLAVLALVAGLVRRLAPAFPPAALLLLLCAVVLFTPLPLLALIAMEHTMQCYVSLLLMGVAVRILAATHSSSDSALTIKGPLEWSLVLAAVLASTTRFEGCFLVAIVCAFLFVRRRFGLAIVAGTAAVLPIALFSLYSVHHGASWLPNSLMLKAARPESISHNLVLFAGSQGLLGSYSRHQGLAELWLVALAFCGAGFLRRSLLSRQTQYGLGTFLLLALVHCQFARIGWVYRYEAYLILLGLVFVGFALWELRTHTAVAFAWASRPLAAALITIALLACFILRVRDTFNASTDSAVKFYQGTYQTARFAHAYYNDGSVAACDIGVLSYLTEVQTLDLAGLGSNDVTQLVLHHRFNRASVYALAQAHHVRLAMLTKSRYFASDNSAEADVIPPQWIEIGRLEIPSLAARENDPHFARVANYQPYFFYAVDPAEATALRQHFAEFAASLPPEVIAVPSPMQPPRGH